VDGYLFNLSIANHFLPSVNSKVRIQTVSEEDSTTDVFLTLHVVFVYDLRAIHYGILVDNLLQIRRHNLAGCCGPVPRFCTTPDAQAGVGQEIETNSAKSKNDQCSHVRLNDAFLLGRLTAGV